MKVIRASAPGRCSIVGNPSDGYGGTVISCSVSLRAHAEVRPAERMRLTVSGQSIDVQAETDLDYRGDYVDMARRVIRHLGLAGEKMELNAHSDVPFQSGLAGSTAMYTAIFGACMKWAGRDMGPYEIAERLHKIEREMMGMQCGYQDHYMAVFGGLQCMDFRDKQNYVSLEDEVYPTVESLDGKVPGLPFVVAHTGVSRVSGAILKPMRKRWEDGDRAVVEGYARAGRIGLESKRAFVDGNWPRLGALMNENHAIQQRLGASGETNDALIAAARNAGALGAKLAGAGGGGTIVALATDPERVIAALRAAGASEFFSPLPCPGLVVEERTNS